MNLTAGTEIDLQAYVPGDAVAQFVDTLTPQFELYDPTDTLVATSAADPVSGLQSLSATAAAKGAYRVRVLGANSTAGEYFLSVSTIPPLVPQVAFGNGAALGSAFAPASAAKSLVSGANAVTSTTVANGAAATASSPAREPIAKAPSPVSIVAPRLATGSVTASRPTRVASSAVQDLHDLVFEQFGIVASKR